MKRLAETSGRGMDGPRRRRAIGAARALFLPWLISWLAGARAGRAETFIISLPVGGAIPIELSHVGPEGGLVSPGEPSVPPFRPPSIFSAPLPSGSGARALGLGAFTAVADDATAASWNPGGLVQLERPEASFVLRYSAHESRHASDDADYQVGRDEYEGQNLNYLSAVLPVKAFNRPCVVSLNYQEAYDFEMRFHADQLGRSSRREEESRQSATSDTQVDHFSDGVLDVTITSELTTRLTSQMRQLLQSDMLTDISFEQEGIIDAVSPALAVEVIPGLSVGGALNIYQDDLFGNRPIGSSSRASYSGASSSRVQTRDTRETTGTYTYEGTWTPAPIEIMPGIVVPIPPVPISGEGVYPPFSDSGSGGGSDGIVFDGEYSEENRFDDLHGWNLTLGGLWSVSRHLSLGGSVDLPWLAEAEQEQTIRSRETAYDASRTVVLDRSEYVVTERKDVEFRFPLFWSVGAVWKWNNVLSTALDVSQTRWSDFYYRADGEEKINPLDGRAYEANRLDDCWAVRLGAEYIWVLRATEIPLRAGLSWEQRPAVGAPDEFYGVNAGTGLSLGKDPGKLILDVAYAYSWGDDVLGTLVPEQEGLSTDMREHQVYVSCIYHF
ncbi:MAG TPA: hypothetical protein P5567_08695 [Kiritimatiellia bacterium]|nr:hypothetical protein [Kiritimatiellia bacterium]HRZ12520.1 hypothetical protein [Kiritimatiellia bacterium]HSA17722.1 hypothetical protein [Kiritimatiellia bacterium]